MSADARPGTAPLASMVADLPCSMCGKQSADVEREHGSVKDQPKLASRISRSRVPYKPEPQCRSSAGVMHPRSGAAGIEPRTGGL